MANVEQNVLLASGQLAQSVAVVDTNGAQSFPAGLFVGLRAMTTQSYTEANVKNGLQFECGTTINTIAAGANLDILFITGAKPVIVKSRSISFSGAGIVATVYEGTTTSAAGSTLAVSNLSRINPIPTTATVTQGPTVTAIGNLISAPNSAVGSTTQGQNILGTFSVGGAERVLKPNTTYLLRVNNTDSSSAKVAVYFSWYEGTPDLPLP